MVTNNGIVASRVNNPSISSTEQKNSAKVARPSDTAGLSPMKLMNLSFLSAKWESLAQPWLGIINTPNTSLKINVAMLNANGE